MARDYGAIMVLDRMIEEFDQKEPRPGRETTAFIKRWRTKEMEEQHMSIAHLRKAVHGINRAEIENIKSTQKLRNAPRTGNNQLVRG